MGNCHPHELGREPPAANEGIYEEPAYNFELVHHEAGGAHPQVGDGMMLG